MEMYCINSGMWDNGHRLLTFYLLLELFDLASAVLLGARSLDAPIFPLSKAAQVALSSKYDCRCSFTDVSFNTAKEKCGEKSPDPQKKNKINPAFKYTAI